MKIEDWTKRFRRNEDSIKAITAKVEFLKNQMNLLVGFFLLDQQLIWKAKVRVIRKKTKNNEAWRQPIRTGILLQLPLIGAMDCNAMDCTIGATGEISLHQSFLLCILLYRNQNLTSTSNCNAMGGTIMQLSKATWFVLYPFSLQKLSYTQVKCVSQPKVIFVWLIFLEFTFAYCNWVPICFF